MDQGNILFEDTEYFENVFGVKAPLDNDREKIETAFNLAHETRKFEIELFWKRGTYYWAFILGAFTAYLFCFVSFIDNLNSTDKFCNLSFLKNMFLLILVMMCFIFCLAWVLINKGSKFWQENWEQHINVLENDFTGKLYKTILNTNDKSSFSKNPFCEKPFDFSVTKITTITSIILMIVSFGFTIFHFCLLILSLLNISTIKWQIILNWVILIFAISFFIIAIIVLLRCEGNKKNISPHQEKWKQL